MGWITALTSTAIRSLVDEGALQLSLLDEKNLAEITSPEYPGERLMVYHNPVLEERRRRKREALLQATEKSLEKSARRRSRTSRHLSRVSRSAPCSRGHKFHRYETNQRCCYERPN